MSNTFSIACKECNEHLWIGQGHHKYWGNITWHLYTADEYVKNLTQFLTDHFEHELIFGDNDFSPFLQMKDYRNRYDT